MYTEIEIERGNEAWDMEKETKKEAESNHQKKSMAINSSKIFLDLGMKYSFQLSFPMG